jgi:hypothetical protein
MSIKQNYVKDVTKVQQKMNMLILKNPYLGRRTYNRTTKLPLKKKLSEKILFSSPEIKQLEKDAFASIELLRC